MAGFRRSTWFALGLMMGSFVGAALGLLLAPERGEETRRELRSLTQPAVESIRDAATRLAGRTEPPAEEEGQPPGPEAEAATEGEEPPEPEAEAAEEESTAGEPGDVS
jgi:gas vesicle protein